MKDPCAKFQVLTSFEVITHRTLLIFFIIIADPNYLNFNDTFHEAPKGNFFKAISDFQRFFNFHHFSGAIDFVLMSY